MKKKFSFAILVVILFASQISFGQAYQKGDKLLNAGIGFSGYGLPINASLEFGIHKNVSVGASAEYTRYGVGEFGSWNFFNFGARGSYHLGEILKTNDKLDPYAGITLGYWSASWSGDNDFETGYGNTIYWAGHLGARYFFKPKLGAFAEVGAGSITGLKVGVALKF